MDHPIGTQVGVVCKDKLDTYGNERHSTSTSTLACRVLVQTSLVRVRRVFLDRFHCDSRSEFSIRQSFLDIAISASVLISGSNGSYLIV